jgi:hypothetical protein
MKQAISLAALIFCFFVAGAQAGHEGHNHNTAVTAVTPANSEVLVFHTTSHDFGRIPQGKPVYYNFEVVNTGKEPMKLDNVSASCGCTTPEWSREAIAPGSKTVIRVGYNAAAEGPFDKPITISFAGGTKQLKITGYVWKAPEGAAPANSSVQFLKKQNL